MSDKTDSDPPAEEKLKQAGRVPAKKIGGVRVARREKRTSDGDSKANDEDSGQEETKTNELDNIRQTNNILASTDLAAQAEKDYPEAAVRASHEKPLPCHQKPVNNQPRPRQTNQVFQPQRFN